MSYDNNLRGVLFRNDQKRDGKQDPDYRGQCEISGTEYWISAWINTSKTDSSKYMALKFQAKERKAQRAADSPAQPAAADFDDEIPF